MVNGKLISKSFDHEEKDKIFISNFDYKNKIILNVFKQFARNNRLQVNKLIKYIDYFLRNYLTKMPIEYVENLKTNFQEQLQKIEKKR